ncbi:MAG: hypothetical protein ABSE99_17260 [Terracidiphilus sp.]|jgi:hypothetical protein
MPISLTPDAFQWVCAIKEWYKEDLPILIQWTRNTVSETLVRQEAHEGIYLSMVVATLRSVLLEQQHDNTSFINALKDATDLEQTEKGLALNYPKAINFLSAVLPGLTWSHDIRPVVLANIKRTLETHVRDRQTSDRQTPTKR